MADDFNQPYQPEARHTNVNSLYGNHFRFDLESLPDVTFFVQSVSIPSVMSSVVDQPNPFVVLPQVGDHLKYNPFDVVYVIDSKFKNYFSLYYWLKGYGFPHSYEERAAFLDNRRNQVPNPRPQIRELDKTRAILSILQPDTNSTIATIHYFDVFPTAIGSVEFTTTDSEPPLLVSRVTFALSDFEIHLTQP
jgi:hypothetical protein